MATIIKSVAFENFYNYYGSYDMNRYVFTSGVNIISADNNMGKSKFYNGFLWLLNNQVYDSDLRALTNANDSLEKIASSKARIEEDNFKVGFMIEFLNEEAAYTVEKSVCFSRNYGQWNHTEPRLDVMIHKKNTDTPIHDVEDIASIINELIPPALRSYALLQGESMERLVDLSSSTALAKTIEDLAEISILNETCNITSKLFRMAKELHKKKDKESTKNNSEEQALKDNYYRMISEKEQYEELLSRNKEELSAAKMRKGELDAYISNSTKREDLRINLTKIDVNISRWEESIKNIETSITGHIFIEENPWLLMGLQDELDNFEEKRLKHIQDIALLNNEGALIIKLPEGSPDASSLVRMLNDERCEICGREAKKGSEEWKHIQMILNRPSTHKQTRNDFSKFYGELSKSAGYYRSSILKVENDIEKTHQKLEYCNDQLKMSRKEREDVLVSLSNAGGDTNHIGPCDKEVVSEYEKLIHDIDSLNSKIKENEGKIDVLGDSISTIKSKIDKFSQHESLKKYDDLENTMKSIYEIIKDTKENIYKQTIEVLEKEANDKYEALTAGNQSSGGKLVFDHCQDIVNVLIRDKMNGDLTGLGTGFQRMKQLAIVMAIISSKVGNKKKFDYPFIADAPFSEFGENFINNFFQVAPSVFTQSILMIKELYDPKNEDKLTPFGRKILNDMKAGELLGTFYVNIIEDKADPTSLVTKHKCYKN